MDVVGPDPAQSPDDSDHSGSGPEAGDSAVRPPADDPSRHGVDIAGIDPLLPDLFPSLSHGIDWGLDRSLSVLGAVGDPHLAYHTLHVGGTNGKGSVAAVWDSVLRRAGYRVGLYTSPHLCTVRERYRVDGKPSDERALVQSARELRSLFQEHRLTFFEAATVLAFYLFAREGVEIGVVEVGLGGRLDATNVVHPLVTAVTNVALDHADYLGDSLVGIAGEKAGIIKPGVPLVTTETEPHLSEVFRGRALEAGAPFHLLDPLTEIHEMSTEPRSTSFSMDSGAWGRLRLRVPLVGNHQAANTALAIRALELLPPSFRPSREAILAGAGGVHWPGRFDVRESRGVTWVFDVAHNIAGVRALICTLGEYALPEPLVILVGILGDKEWREMLPSLFEKGDAVVLTLPDSAPPERCWDPAEAATGLETSTPMEIVEDFTAAVDRARTLAAGGSVLVVGSHHTVGDAMKVLEIEPFDDVPALPGSDPSF